MDKNFWGRELDDRRSHIGGWTKGSDFSAAPRALEYLSVATVWYGDGSFKVTPSLFYQLSVVRALDFSAR